LPDEKEDIGSKEVKMRKYTKEEIERHLTPAGDYRRKNLEALGVQWPPKKGWKERLLRGEDPNQETATRKHRQIAPVSSRSELRAIIAEQQTEIKRLHLELEEAVLRAAWLDWLD
jgi:hypothetical protein